jgi:hypothetical protein
LLRRRREKPYATWAVDPGPESGDATDVEKFARKLFYVLCRLDFLAMALNR